jgi:hypothetical protein
MGTKSFVQIEINAVFTTTSGKMQFRSGVFDHFKHSILEYSTKSTHVCAPYKCSINHSTGVPITTRQMQVEFRIGE